MDLTDTSVTFAATPPVEAFWFLQTKAMTGEKKKNAQDELVTAFFDISRVYFHWPVCRKSRFECKVMLTRAMYGTKDAAQRFDLYCERTMEKLDDRIGVFNPCLYKHAVKDIKSAQTQRRLCDARNTGSDC